MSDHTEESLNSLANKAEVVAVAEGLGLPTGGTRAKITRRILAAQGGGAAAADTVTTNTSEDVGNGDAGGEPSARSESSPLEEGASDSASSEEPAPAEPATDETDAALSLSEKAATRTKVLLESCFGTGRVDDDTVSGVLADLAAGKQPCVHLVMKPEGKYALETHDEAFSPLDKSGDIHGRNIALNIARALVGHGLYPG